MSMKNARRSTTIARASLDRLVEGQDILMIDEAQNWITPA